MVTHSLLTRPLARTDRAQDWAAPHSFPRRLPLSSLALQDAARSTLDAQPPKKRPRLFATARKSFWKPPASFSGVTQSSPLRKQTAALHPQASSSSGTSSSHHGSAISSNTSIEAADPKRAVSAPPDEPSVISGLERVSPTEEHLQRRKQRAAYDLDSCRSRALPSLPNGNLELFPVTYKLEPVIHATLTEADLDLAHRLDRSQSLARSRTLGKRLSRPRLTSDVSTSFVGSQTRRSPARHSQSQSIGRASSPTIMLSSELGQAEDLSANEEGSVWRDIFADRTRHNVISFGDSDGRSEAEAEDDDEPAPGQPDFDEERHLAPLPPVRLQETSVLSLDETVPSVQRMDRFIEETEPVEPPKWRRTWAELAAAYGVPAVPSS